MLMADFVTAVKYQLPIKMVIVKNNTLGQIKWEREDPADCGRIVEEFLNVPGPAILQAEVDPLEPPLPAKITADQALKFAESLARGEPNRSKIALTALSSKVREMV